MSDGEGLELGVFCPAASNMMTLLHLREPPNTVKSWEKMNTLRPLMSPCPVTTPSP